MSVGEVVSLAGALVGYAAVLSIPLALAMAAKRGDDMADEALRVEGGSGWRAR